MKRWQQLAIAAILLGNAILWLVPSSVAELVARHRDVLLGRYSVDRMTVLLGVLPVSALAVYLLAATEPRQRRRRVFGVVTLLASGGLTLLVADVALRFIPRPEYYVRQGRFYTRTPGQSVASVYDDVPLPRSYPDAPRGYPRVEWTFTSDTRGFRNPRALDAAEIVVLGDSFAEGTKVTDAGIWPRLVAMHAKRTVYNLGMSGGDASYYAFALERHGLALRPRTVVLLVYEGNDLRGDGTLEDRDAPISKRRRLRDLVRSSPVRNATKEAMIRLLGPLNAAGSFRAQELVAWQPVRVAGKPYAFAPKRVIELYLTAEEMAGDPGFRTLTLGLEAVERLCRKAGARLLVVYAPSKPRIALPLSDRPLPAEDLRGWLLLRRKKLHRAHRDPPQGAAFLTELHSCLEQTEQAVAAWCAGRKLGWLSLTGPLRAAARAGTQVYFTYDQHWTPAGHEVVAREVARALARQKN